MIPLTLDDLFCELGARGVVLSTSPAAPGKLQYYPASRCSDLLPHMRQHKDALIASVPFARSGRMVKIHSDLLSCAFWLAADNARVPPDPGPRPHLHEGLVVYRTRCMEQIVRAHPILASAQTPERIVGDQTARGLRLLHAVLTEFGGELLPPPSTLPTL